MSLNFLCLSFPLCETEMILLPFNKLERIKHGKHVEECLVIACRLPLEAGMRGSWEFARYLVPRSPGRALLLSFGFVPVGWLLIIVRNVQDPPLPGSCLSLLSSCLLISHLASGASSLQLPKPDMLSHGPLPPLWVLSPNTPHGTLYLTCSPPKTAQAYATSTEPSLAPL